MRSSGTQYRILRKLAQGGMAEVYLGEAIHPSGRMRRVAIKRMLPHLVQDAELVGMLDDEARLGARLQHDNIVRVYGQGVSRGDPFVVMEYVEGVDVATVLSRARRAGRPVPLGDALAIAVGVCAGLHWAHGLRDEDGAPMGIIHRDITPPNILLGLRGAVKICDFGLAKATTQRNTTEPGLIKGKFGYLSPEAASGHAVDARTDIFSLGIVLWEMLATQRLFLGDNDYETVKLVQRAQVPSLSALNSEVDGVFEELLLRALARDPDRRFESAGAFMESLLAYADFMDVRSDLPSLVARCTGPETASGIRAAVATGPSGSAPPASTGRGRGGMRGAG